MCGSMAVSAHDQHPRLAQALLGRNYVHDALASVVETEERNTRGAAVPLESLDHGALFRVRDARQVTTIGGDVMVGRGKSPMWDPRLEPAASQHLESGCGAVLKKMAVHIQECLGIFAHEDGVLLPDLLEKCPGSDHWPHDDIYSCSAILAITVHWFTR